MYIFVYKYPRITVGNNNIERFVDIEKLKHIVSNFFFDDPKTKNELTWIKTFARAELIPHGFILSIPDEAEAIAFKMMESEIISKKQNSLISKQELELAFVLKDPDWKDITGDKDEFIKFRDATMQRCLDIVDNSVTALKRDFPDIIDRLEQAAPYLSADFIPLVSSLKAQANNDFHHIEYQKEQIHNDLKKEQKKIRNRLKKYMVFQSISQSS